MPIYLYRREDGTTFEYKQKFLDDPLDVDPDTGQKVVRVVQPTGVIFKGSGFYINDSKSASKSSLNSNGSSHSKEASESKSDDKSTTATTETKSEAKTETKSEAKSESKAPAKSSAAD